MRQPVGHSGDGTACQVEPETCRLQQSELPPDISLEPAILIILDGQQLEQGECALEQARLRLALGQRAVEQGTDRGKAGEPQWIVEKLRRHRLAKLERHLAKLFGKSRAP